MGKRKKRLTMAKYAKKYATIRATVARLKAQAGTLDEPTSPQQDASPSAQATPVLKAPKEASLPAP